MMPDKNNYVLNDTALTVDTKGGVSKEIMVSWINQERSFWKRWDLTPHTNCLFKKIVTFGHVERKARVLGFICQDKIKFILMNFLYVSLMQIRREKLTKH